MEEKITVDVLRYSEEGFEIELTDEYQVEIKIDHWASMDYHIGLQELSDEIQLKETELRALKKAKQFWGGE